jgi:hypothetical protein
MSIDQSGGKTGLPQVNHFGFWRRLISNIASISDSDNTIPINEYRLIQSG